MTISACTIINSDARVALSSYKNHFDLIITSPPYADARKKHYDSIAPDKFADWLLSFSMSWWQALKESGSLVLNLNDKVVNGERYHYAWQAVEKLSQAGWCSIEDYIWHKKNSVPGRWPTRLRDGFEYCFHLAKQKRPYVNCEAVKVPIRDWVKKRKCTSAEIAGKANVSKTGSEFSVKRSYWQHKKMVLPSNVLYLSSVCSNKQHPAVFPVALPEFFIKLLCPKNGVVLDPFAGSGTTGVAALNLGRECVLIDNKKEYVEVAYARLHKEAVNACEVTMADSAG